MSASHETNNRHTITLFLASPSDTARDRVASLINDVGEEPAYRQRVSLALQRWDDRSQPVPMPFLGCSQEQVEDYKTPAQECDLVIGLLKHRLGSALQDEEKYGISQITGNTKTGTEWELHQAQHHEIETWVFRDLSDFVQPPSLSRNDRQAQQQQHNWVCDYFEHVGKPGHTHSGADDLSEQVERLLREWLKKKLQALDKALSSTQTPRRSVSTAIAPPPSTPLTDLQQSVQHALLAGKLPDPESISALYRKENTPDNIDAWLLRRWAYWARRVDGVATDAGELHQHFVTLQLMLDRSRLADDPPLAQLEGERWREQGKYESLPQLLTSNPDNAGWVLVGPPGSGKSTVLQQYEMHCCVEALRDTGNTPEVCLWFRLSGYNQDSPAPDQWLKESWQQQNPAMPELDWVMEHCRVRFLLDGLNEIRTGSRRLRADIVGHWAQWADNLLASALPPLFSVHTHEYSDQLSAGGFHATRINLLLWTEDKIKRYIDLRLGEDSPLCKATRYAKSIAEAQ